MTTGEWPLCRVNVGDRKLPCDPRDDGRCQHCGDRLFDPAPLEAVRTGFRQLGDELVEQVSREYKPERIAIPGDISGVEFYAPSGQTQAVMGWAPDGQGSPLPSESVRPLSSLADEPPDSCDLCSKAFGPDTPWRRMTIVVDSAPRSARDRSPLLMEDEWRLCVCTGCHEEFDLWLFRGSSELDTLRPPPPAPDTEPETRP